MNRLEIGGTRTGYSLMGMIDLNCPNPLTGKEIRFLSNSKNKGTVRYKKLIKQYKADVKKRPWMYKEYEDHGVLGLGVRMIDNR